MANQTIEPAEVFRQIQHSDAAVRLEGVRWIEKQTRHCVPGNCLWLEDPETVSRLLPLLQGRETAIVKEALASLAHIGDRFRYDARIPEASIPFLSHEQPAIRVRAIWGTSLLDSPEGANHILPLFADKDKTVRAMALSSIGGRWELWTSEQTERIRQEAMKCLDDRAMDVKIAAGRLFVTVGIREDIKMLKQKLATVKGTNYRQDFRESIQLLEEGLDNRSA